MQSIAVVTAALAAALASAEPLYAWPDAASLPAMPAVTSPAAADFPGLPDPLQFFDHAAGSPMGAAVQDGAAWQYQRRPEILDMLRHYMYGHEPPPPTDVTFAVLSVESDYLDGTATKKVVRGVYGPPGSRPMVMNVYLPNAADGPVPVIAALNAQGNEAIEPGGPRAGRWDLPGTLGAGIALATAVVDDFAADSANRYADALIDPYAEAGFQGNWRTQGAWAWGLSRMVDYLETVPALDPNRIAVTGFSRRGKAALWAGALDERIALVGPHQSGAGGPVPNRPGWGNNTGYRNSFTWWYLPGFNEMSVSDYERLPFDQHFQVALIAPRRAFFTENSSSGANFNGALAIRTAAAPVWDFLGADAETGVVLEWDTDSAHRHEPYHWAALHAAVLSLPKGLSANPRVWPDVADLPYILTVASASHPDFPGLPDPLRFFDHESGNVSGPALATSADWFERRRPEILDMLRHYKYGTEPGPPQDPQFSLLSVEPDFLGGLAVKMVVRGDYGPPGAQPLLINLYVPDNADKPVPVIAALNAQGNELIEPGGSRADRWDLPGTLQAGIALATVAVSDFAADGSRFSNALIGPYASSGFTGDWKTIAAWAWGLARVVDYLEQVPEIDPHRIALTGYSRRGKAALWAAALDERVALAAPHQTGTGGAHPTRSTWGWAPTFRHQFPHWFLDRYNAIDRDGSPNDYFRLPFDQHFAVAAVAPRRVLLSENRSYGANYNGLLAVRTAAAPVWDFLGADAETDVVLEWNTTTGHSFEPQHWAVIHEAVNALPPGGEAGFLEWARDHSLYPEDPAGTSVAALAASDPNGDGTTLLEAYLFGLDPETPRSVPPVVSRADGRIRIALPQRRGGTGRPGRGYHWRGVEQSFERAVNLSGPWTRVGLEDLVPVAVSPGPSDFTETVTYECRRADSNGPVFYRVRYRFSLPTINH